MTNREKYKQAFSVLRSSCDMTLEVEKMAILSKKAKIRATAAAIITICLVITGGSGVVYAADVGGIQRMIQLWIEGDQTDVSFTYDENGTYDMAYETKDVEIEQLHGGGVAIEDDGTERPLTEEELLEDLKRPTVRYEEDGTVWVYYYDQKIEITDRFQDGVCYVKVSNGEETLYMTILYQDGWCSSPHKYEPADSLRVKTRQPD